MGCWQLAPSIGWGDKCSATEAETVIKTAVDCGITAFDTAEGYGDGESERRLGRALGNKRDDVIIVSKIWPDAELTLEAYQKRLDETLLRLNRDYVDLYLIHWPSDFMQNASLFCDIMFALKESKKALTVGLSNFHEQDLELLGDQLADFSINQVPYNLLCRFYEGRTRELCHQSGVTYMAYAPLARGFLARKLTETDRQVAARTNRYDSFFDEPIKSEVAKVYDLLASIGQDLGRHPSEIALAWVIAQENIQTTIIGSRKPEQVKECAKAGDCELTAEMLQALTAASDRFVANTERVLQSPID